MSVLTAGETMALLDPLGDGVPGPGTAFTLRFAGAESNFAIALARLGVSVSWISRLGRDPFGDMIEHGLAEEGVDVRRVQRDDARTGLFVKWRGAEERGVAYYRAGSAASRLCPDDVPDEALEGVQLVHLTGITMAISETACELVVDLARRARARGATVLFDPNFRPALPDTAEAAAARQRDVLPFVDWYLTGEDEATAPLGRRGDPCADRSPRRRARRDRRRRSRPVPARGRGRRRDRSGRRLRRRLRVRPARGLGADRLRPRGQRARGACARRHRGLGDAAPARGRRVRASPGGRLTQSSRMTSVIDVAPGLWVWRVAHPDWNPELDWPKEVTSTCVESGGEVAVLDPLAPPDDATEVWARLDGRPPTMAVILKPDHVRDVDVFVTRYGVRAFGPYWFWRDDIPESELEGIEPGRELPGGLLALYDGRGRNETPLWLPEQQALVFADGLNGARRRAPRVGDALARGARSPSATCAPRPALRARDRRARSSRSRQGSLRARARAAAVGGDDDDAS